MRGPPCSGRPYRRVVDGSLDNLGLCRLASAARADTALAALRMVAGALIAAGSTRGVEDAVSFSPEGSHQGQPRIRLDSSACTAARRGVPR